jgi:ATP-dependent helicase/nuclease subunit B
VAHAREALAPAIERVFALALTTTHTDLLQWLRRMAEERTWVPLYFELGFGLSASEQRDPESRLEPVALSEGLKLRGAVDLVERSVHPAPDGRPVLRATDHKTGRSDLKASAVTAGARVLQPLLYALALERMFEDVRVDAGRLYFCTTRADFESHEVPLHAGARRIASEFVQGVGALLTQGFLPAAPAHTREAGSACEQCSYRVVCGPYEAERVARVKAKDFGRLAPLQKLRGLP